MTQQDKASAFRALHKHGSTLILFNAWDAGSAQGVAKAGAAAIATGSWSIAAISRKKISAPSPSPIRSCCTLA